MSISWFCTQGQWGMWGWLPLLCPQPTEVVLSTVDLFCCWSLWVWRQPPGRSLSLETEWQKLSAKSRDFGWAATDTPSVLSVLMKHKNTCLFLVHLEVIRFFSRSAALNPYQKQEWCLDRISILAKSLTYMFYSRVFNVFLKNCPSLAGNVPNFLEYLLGFWENTMWNSWTCLVSEYLTKYFTFLI